MHPSKACAPTEVSAVPNDSEVKPVPLHPLNAYSPMVARADPNTKEGVTEQESKA